jgi:hypothetical protein
MLQTAIDRFVILRFQEAEAWPVLNRIVRL